MAVAATPSYRVDVVEELCFYALAGQPSSSREIVREVIAGEERGLGTAFIWCCPASAFAETTMRVIADTTLCQGASYVWAKPRTSSATTPTTS